MARNIMTDHTALIAELLEHAEWEDQRRSLACADVLRRAAEALGDAPVIDRGDGYFRILQRGEVIIISI